MILGDAGVTGAMGGMLACCKVEGFLDSSFVATDFFSKTEGGQDGAAKAAPLAGDSMSLADARSTIVRRNSMVILKEGRLFQLFPQIFQWKNGYFQD